MELQFVNNSKILLGLTVISLILVMIFMSSSINPVVGTLGKIGILLLLAYITMVDWKQIQQMKKVSHGLENIVGTPNVNTNIIISYVFLLLIAVNFIFVAKSLFQSSEPKQNVGIL